MDKAERNTTKERRRELRDDALLAEIRSRQLDVAMPDLWREALAAWGWIAKQSGLPLWGEVMAGSMGVTFRSRKTVGDKVWQCGRDITETELAHARGPALEYVLLRLHDCVVDSP